MPDRKPVLTGTVDKDQLDYESEFNPDAISYIGPRTVTNHNAITNSPSDSGDLT